jgi:transposase
MLSGIVLVNRNGLRWCDAPKVYGPHNHWKRWGDEGAFFSRCGEAGCRKRRVEDRHDRRDLPQGTPHGIYPAS